MLGNPPAPSDSECGGQVLLHYGDELVPLILRYEALLLKQPKDKIITAQDKNGFVIIK